MGEEVIPGITVHHGKKNINTSHQELVKKFFSKLGYDSFRICSDGGIHVQVDTVRFFQCVTDDLQIMGFRIQ